MRPLLQVLKLFVLITTNVVEHNICVHAAPQIPFLYINMPLNGISELLSALQFSPQNETLALRVLVRAMNGHYEVYPTRRRFVLALKNDERRFQTKVGWRVESIEKSTGLHVLRAGTIASRILWNTLALAAMGVQQASPVRQLFLVVSNFKNGKRPGHDRNKRCLDISHLDRSSVQQKPNDPLTLYLTIEHYAQFGPCPSFQLKKR